MELPWLSTTIVTLVCLGVWEPRASLASRSRCDGVVHSYLWSVCMECSINAMDGFLFCPSNYRKITTGEGVRRCSFRINFGFGSMNVPGCQHRCERTLARKECCDGFWGSDCQACPGWPACSGRGSCSDKINGNGTCTCKIGFSGFACELCSDWTKFGQHCNETCPCVHGQCDNGINGTGHCKPDSCHLGYTGQYCNISLPRCVGDNQCQENATCFKLNNTDTCLCDPGYRNSSGTCLAINQCSNNTHGCHAHADCFYLGPGKHNCTCTAGYTGDGIVCAAIDLCQKDNGGCPSNSTVCNYLAPGKSNCSCAPGFQNYSSSIGCTVINLCENGGGCDVNANCTMEGPGMKRCDCLDGYRGNGTICYGNILQRVNELNLHGPDGLKGELSIAIDLLSRSFARPLSGAGPFTLFLMVNRAFSNLTQDEMNQLLANTDMASHFVSQHLVASDVDSFLLKKYGKVSTLQGINAAIMEYQNILYVQLDGQPRNATLLVRDLLAGNGMIHVIDKIMWQFGDYQNTTSKLSLQLLQGQGKFSIFASLLQLSGVASEITALGGVLTLLAPVNSAFDRIDNITMNYLATTDMGKRKMRSLLRNHILSSKVVVTDLIYRDKVTSLEGESLVVQLIPNGQIVLDEHTRVIETNILTRDGVIHVTDNLLIPDDIQPLLKNFCNKQVFKAGICYRCEAIDVMPRKGCPQAYEPSSTKTACQYILRYGGAVIGIFNGCKATSCTAEVPACCAGFYGVPCHPCPGPFHNECHGNGKCDDGVGGAGTCQCWQNFKGTACEMCEDDNKFGPFCNQTCTCIKGKCDSGPKTNGTCQDNTCLPGFHGINCDQRNTPCLSSVNLRCHVLATCVREGDVDRCQCNAGYEGSGQQCYEIDPCSKPNRGGCHHEATCTKTGPGTNNCTCDDGFRGDGRVCVPVDPCQEKGGGYCHSNADCQYKGPGQSVCVCKAGYTGDGSTCYELNLCLVNNGGCSQDAQCVRTGPGNHTCHCNMGFIGNGFFCLGSVATVISRVNPNLETLMRKGNMLHRLSDPTSVLTLLAPSVSALSQLSDSERQYWTNTTEKLMYLMKYHLANGSYTFNELKNKTSLQVSNGLPLAVALQGDKLLIGGSARVVQANISAANGLVHVIDKVLLPPHLPPGDELPLTSELLKNTTEFFDFYKFLKTFSLLSSLDACQACTIFAPTSSTLKNHLLLQNKSLSARTLEYHVVEHYLSEEGIQNGQEFATWLGRDYLLKVTKPSKGKLKVNGVEVIIKGQKARRAVVYGLNGVLQPIKSHCDTIKSTYGYGGCTSCFFLQPTCPTGWTRIRVDLNSCWILFPLLRGCHARCRKDITTKKCCPGFWGNDCQSCPGNLTAPCSGQGSCDDGKSGSGHCVCHTNFTGTSCEKCSSSKYGANCDNDCKDSCSNGICNEGKSGDGSCLCHHGWKGQYCNTSANYSNCLPTICSQHATCYGPTGGGRCECDGGYSGNGTHCTEINPCTSNNGGCDQNANCTVSIKSPEFRSCQCKEGFSGDGTFCFEIDPCQRNNGGCHGNATCASIAPGKRNCFCKEGFSGDGVGSCVGVNPCDVDNGGCSDRAECKQVGPHQRQCTCNKDYVGDGVTCIGDTMEALKLDPELSKVEKLIKEHSLDGLLASHGLCNLLAPVNTALERMPSRSRKRRSVDSQSDQVQMLLKYHIIGCVRITNHTFQAGSVNFTTLLGPVVTVKREGNEISFHDSYGNKSKVVGIYETANGFIMKLDSVLSPPMIDSKPKGSFLEVASKLGYTEFVKLVELAGLKRILDSPISRPVLMFWPTDEAVNSLPQDLRDRLIDPANVADLANFVKYHVVMQVPSDFSTQSFLKSGAGLELRTFEGATLFVACRGGKGDIYVNGESRIVQRDVTFNGGVAFGVDSVLVPLGFGGHCDEISDTQLKGQCGNCFVPASCPQETSLVDTTNHGCVYDGDLKGCQPVCLQRNRVQKCCTNYYGPDCLVCPGGVQSPCSGRGTCIDGLQGSGDCVCDSPFNGTACEQCKDISDSCAAPTTTCQEDNGGCHVFATCSQTSANHVMCTCKAGYQGDGYYCQMTDVCATDNGGCGDNATCHFTGPGARRCLCKRGFYQVGVTCKPHHPNSMCTQDHGGCSIHADCLDDGSGVVCSCRPGFTGDGYTCESHIIQVLRETKSALEFYKALYQLSTLSSEGLSLFRDLESQSRTYTVFVPINSAVNQQKFTLHFLKNHILSGRLPLINLKEQRSVRTIAGTKLLIKKLANGQVVVNGVAHIIGDIPATNGVVHMTDQMIPVVGPPPPTTAAPANPTSTSTSTKLIPTTGQGQQPVTVTTATSSSIPPGNSPHAGKQESGSVGEGAVAGIIIGCIVFVFVIACVIWVLKKKKFPSRAFYKKDAATVQFSNEAFTDSSMMSFDNVLCDTFEDPVLLAPLDFPIDDKKTLPYQGTEHGDFENPVYHQMQGFDTEQYTSGIYGDPASSQDLDEAHTVFANPMYDEIPDGQRKDMKLNLDASSVPGQEDTC